MNKVAIIGCGHVGLAIAYGLACLHTNLELYMIDDDNEKLLGNINDLNHMLSTTKMKMGDYNDLEKCDIVIITVGIKPLKNRTSFLQKSYLMIEDVMKKINQTHFDGFIIVVSNPNDVLTTYISKKYARQEKVVGTGCMLDINRLKYFLACKYAISPFDVEGTIVGEHGMEQIILWDTIKIKKENIFLQEEEKKDLSQKVCEEAYKIVSKKGYTNYGIASCVIWLIQKIIDGKSFHFTGSFYDKKNEIAYSRPLVYENGVFKIDQSTYIDDIITNCIKKIKKEYFVFQNKKIIGIDLDDTITDIQDEMQYYAAIFDKEKNGNGIIDKNKYLVGEMYGWNNDLKDEFFRTYRYKIVNRAKVRPKVSKILHKWKRLGYQIYIITARNSKYYQNPYQETYDWLLKHRIPFDKLIVECPSKQDICKRMKINYFIDDMPNNCVEVSKIKGIKVFMIANGNNYCDDEKIIRVHKFEEIDRGIGNV